MSVLDPRPTLASHALGAAVFGVASAVAAVTGVLVSAGVAEQYRQLGGQFSLLTPFSVSLWTALHTLVALSGWLVWRRAGWSGARPALTVYAVQVGLSTLWTPLLFSTGGTIVVAFVALALLGLAIIATIALFLWHSRLAAALLLPYLAWVTLLAVVSRAIWQLS